MERGIGYTESFWVSAMQFIAECTAKRKEILDAAKDTADDTELPDIEALVDDALSFGPDEDGLCFNCWGVTDNYESDRPFIRSTTVLWYTNLMLSWREERNPK